MKEGESEGERRREYVKEDGGNGREGGREGGGKEAWTEMGEEDKNNNMSDKMANIHVNVITFGLPGHEMELSLSNVDLDGGLSRHRNWPLFVVHTWWLR